MSIFKLLLGSSALAVVLGCGPKSDAWRPDPDAVGPSVVVEDSIVLQETDSSQLGGFTAFYGRGADGEIYIADMTRRAILHFGREGAFKGLIGRGGEGPGEFELPGAVVVLPGDSLLGAYDVSKQLLTIFSARDGGYRREVRMNSRDVGSHWAWSHDTVYVPLHMAQQLVGVWSVPDSASRTMTPLPPEMAADLASVIRHGRPGLAWSDSGLVLLLPSRPGVMLVDREGRRIGSLPIPAARRKGEPTNLSELERGPGPADRLSRIAGSSSAGIARLPNGDLVLAHLDMEIEPAATGSVRFKDFKLYISVVRSDLSAACVDGIVPVSTDVPTIPVFLGDTAFVLTREVGGDDKVSSVLRSYRIDTSRCDWIPTGGLVRLAGEKGGR